MSTALQLRRGTTAQHSTFTGAVGEATVDTDKDTLVVHDGATAGGFPLMRADGGGLPFAFRNRIINGGFSVNQRVVSGTVTLAAGTYGHDRWKAGAGGCTYTFATTNNVTTLTITAGTLMQVIEGNNLLSGTHVLTWVGTAQGRIDSGSYGASKITGTAVGGTNQTIEFNTGTVSKVQYEPGAAATAFEFRDDELRRCQRYYEKSYSAATAPGTAATAGQLSVVPPAVGAGAAVFQISFKQAKRAAPTIVAYSPFNGAAGYAYDTSAATNRSVTYNDTNENGVAVKNAVTTTAEATHTLHWTATAEL